MNEAEEEEEDRKWASEKEMKIVLKQVHTALFLTTDKKGTLLFKAGIIFSR